MFCFVFAFSLSVFSFFRYPVSFLCANELRSEEFYCRPNEFKLVPTSAAPADPFTCSEADLSTAPPNCIAVCPLSRGIQLLDQFSIEYDREHRDINLLVIFLFVIGFNMINYLAIRCINHVKR
jgi:hypothetical protein